MTFVISASAVLRNIGQFRVFGFSRRISVGDSVNARTLDEISSTAVALKRNFGL